MTLSFAPFWNCMYNFVFGSIRHRDFCAKRIMSSLLSFAYAIYLTRWPTSIGIIMDDNAINNLLLLLKWIFLRCIPSKSKDITGHPPEWLTTNSICSSLEIIRYSKTLNMEKYWSWLLNYNIINLIKGNRVQRNKQGNYIFQSNSSKL